MKSSFHIENILKTENNLNVKSSFFGSFKFLRKNDMQCVHIASDLWQKQGPLIS